MDKDVRHLKRIYLFIVTATTVTLGTVVGVSTFIY